MSTDPSQRALDRTLNSSMPFELKMIGLLSLERAIEHNYVQGTSTVKPISQMTPDDLVD